MARTVGITVLLAVIAVSLSAMPGEQGLRLREPFSQPVGAVIIDPGHGGRDPGAVGRWQDDQGTVHTVLEKDVNLSVALMLRDILQQQADHLDVHMLREDDRYLTLYRRVQLANAVNAPTGTSKIFISIHANAAESSAARGFEVWVYRGKRTENFIAPTVEDPALEALVSALNASLQWELQQSTEKLAESMIRSLDEGIGDRSPSRGIKHEEFYVIRHTLMPSVLIEAGFLSHPQEAALLTDPGYQKEIALAVAEAVMAYDQRLQGSQ